MNRRSFAFGIVGSLMAATALTMPAKAQQPQKPNIILIVSDDFGYGDAGPYGGGEGRGMPTPNLDRLANEGMTFFPFYAQPSCTPGRAAMHDRPHPEPQRHDDRRVPGPGRRIAGGGMDAGLGAEDRRLQDLLHRQMASRRGRLRAAERAGLRRDEVWRPLSPQRLHLWRPDLVSRHAGPELRAMFSEGDQGRDVGQRRARPAKEDFKINGQYVDTPEQGRRRHSVLRRLRREGIARVSRPQRQIHDSRSS